MRKNCHLTPPKKDFCSATKIKIRASRQPYQMNKMQPHIARQSAKKDVTPYAPLVSPETYCKSMCYGNIGRHQLT